jgi:phosphate transport system ATP-binding protein
MSKNVAIQGLHVSYNGTKVVKNISLDIHAGKVTAIIGPSGCGKTTLLRSINRLTELTNSCRVDGKIFVDGVDVLGMDTVLLRRKVGMVFQKPNPFPKSIRENVLYGIKAAKMKADFNAILKFSLEKAALWEDLKDRLNENALNLSVGQQQRLCMARCLAISPEVILMDEPASALDPVSTLKLEESIISMKGDFTQVVVTHNMQEARRIADYTAFVYRGELIEYDETGKIFDSPQRKETQDYINGKFS